MPRKPHEPTEKDRKQVSAMAGFGLKHDQIAKIIGISDETLRKYYSHELDVAESMMNAQIAQNLYSIANSKGPGAITAAIFWLKTRAGWRETSRTEVTGKDGGAIEIESKVIDASALSAEQRESVRQALMAALEVSYE